MYVLLFIFCAFQIFGIFMMSLNEDAMAAAGIHIRSLNASEFIQLVLSQPPSWMLLYIMVFTIYFYMSEFISGYYKNYITLQRARLYSVLSKIIIQAFFTLFMLATLLVADFIGRSVFLETTAIGDFGYFLKLLFTQFLLQWAFSILILCIAMLTKRLLPSMIIGFIFVLNISGMLASGLENMLFDKTYISDFLLINTITNPTDFRDNQAWMIALVIAVTCIGIFSTLAATYKWREDLK